MNAPTPARASCASDTWPAYPVTTTSERARIAKMNVLITAARAGAAGDEQRDRAGDEADHDRQQVRPRTRGPPEVRPQQRAPLGNGPAGDEQRDEHHDEGHHLADAGLRHPRVLAGEVDQPGLDHADADPGDHRGHQVLELADDRRGERGHHEERVGVRYHRGQAARSGSRPHPTTAPASIQFNSAIRSGEMPLTYAPVSDSAVARVSRPNRVHR